MSINCLITGNKNKVFDQKSHLHTINCRIQSVSSTSTYVISISVTDRSPEVYCDQKSNWNQSLSLYKEPGFN